MKLFAADPITGFTIFHEAAYAGSLELLYRIRDLITQPYQSLLQEYNNNGELCIHVAARVHRGMRAIQVIQALLQLGADLNGVDCIHKFTILHQAVTNDDHILAMWLISQPSMNLELKSWDGLTASHKALIDGDEQMKYIFPDNRIFCHLSKYRENEFDFSNNERNACW